MKNYIHLKYILFFILASLFLPSCQKEENLLLPELHIELKDGEYEKVLKDKRYKASGSVTLLDGHGQLMYVNKLQHFRGRGHYSWQQKKKPYQFRLYNQISLLGMQTAQRYCLLQCSNDETCLRNAIALKTSQKTGLGGADVRHVYLFINGKKQGIYLLTTHIEATMECIGKSDIDVLLYLSGYSEYRQGFISNNEVAVSIKHPSKASSQKIDSIKAFYNNFEQAIISPDGMSADETYYSDIIDIASFAKYYLLQEIFQNQDACVGSVYLYYLKDENKFYAGPLWDFDLSMNNAHVNIACREPNVLWASALRNEQYGSSRCLGYYLWQHADFREAVKGCYPEVKEAIEGIARDIRAQQITRIGGIATEELFNYLDQRIAFFDWYFNGENDKVELNALFNDGVIDNKWVKLVVKKGEPTILPKLRKGAFTWGVWQDAETGEQLIGKQTFEEERSISSHWYGYLPIRRSIAHIFQ